MSCFCVGSTKVYRYWYDTAFTVHTDCHVSELNYINVYNRMPYYILDPPYRREFISCMPYFVNKIKLSFFFHFLLYHINQHARCNKTKQQFFVQNALSNYLALILTH